MLEDEARKLPAEKRAGVTDFAVVIPARYASTRLPGKPLARHRRQADGGPRRGAAARAARRAGDHRDGSRRHRADGARARVRGDDDRSASIPPAPIASPKSPVRSGWSDAQIVVNVQGDEPLIEPAADRRVSPRRWRGAPKRPWRPHAPARRSPPSSFDPNVVKVVLDDAATRCISAARRVPWARDASAAHQDVPGGLPVYRHIGIYAYRCAFLRPTRARTRADRALRSAGAAARAVARLPHRRRGHRAAPEAGVDTPEDLRECAALARERKFPDA